MAAAVKYLQRRDVSADQLHYSLRKYTGDPTEVAQFGAFLRRWPMYSEGQTHKDTKRAIMACMAKPHEGTPCLGALFRDYLDPLQVIDDSDLVAMNNIWQCTVMGIEPEVYEAVAPSLDKVTSFFSTYSADFDFSIPNAAIGELRQFVGDYSFADGSLIAEGRSRGLHEDVLINLLADPRPSMLHCIRLLVHHLGVGLCDMHQNISARETVEVLLRDYPPFGSIHRIIQDSEGAIEKTLRVDIRRCNAESSGHTGMTFGFGRHICPGGSLVSGSLVQLLNVLLEKCPARPISYIWEGVPCVRSNPLRRQRLVLRRSSDQS
ncbi:hypothetical protein [Tateyamaria omphalii]|uniref:hypothetical protein n=1 Tax=Tateyamaria omphalii TaxID=299262 RepID=UPI001679B921|nr:hypothetical protein [Tateyamaria omphalii]